MSKCRILGKALVAAGLLAVLTTAGATAAFADPPEDRAIVVDLDDLESFLDSEGDPLTVDTDEILDAERTIRGTESTGVPFEIKIFLAPVVDDAQGFEDFVESAQLFGGANSDPMPPEGSPQPADTHEYVPTFATAVTPTTVSLSWAQGAEIDAAELALDGVPAVLGLTPEFVATDLGPESPHQLSLTLIEDVAGTAPGSAPTPPVSTQCPSPQGVVSADLDDWDLTQTQDAASLLIDNAVRVLTYPGSAAPRAIGMHPLGLPLTAGLPTDLEWDGTSPAPSVRLELDVDADDLADGVLVSSPTDTSVWVADASSTSAVVDEAPSPSTQSGSLDDWALALPNSTILRFGYELGAAGQGDGALASITVG